MTTTLRFDQVGSVACLYSESVDLRSLGRLQVVRATDITFNEGIQVWEVHCASSGRLLHSDPSRGACLAWERENLSPSPTPESNPE
jgi:hypothetical protein